jgi:hypothetical protein
MEDNVKIDINEIMQEGWLNWIRRPKKKIGSVIDFSDHSEALSGSINDGGISWPDEPWSPFSRKTAALFLQQSNN